MNTQKKDKRSVQELAWFMIIIFSLSLISPNISLASGGGPTQPEVQGFTPIGVSDMVDPFTGDFTYNIPLMDVEGYPINIAYNSGVTMDQEASWVGLGWNLNVGSVLRNMRGVPDDFNGDEITKVLHQKPQLDISASVNIGDLEFFGKTLSDKIESVPDPESDAGQSTIDSLKQLGNSLKVNLGWRASYSNYTGLGLDVNLGASFALKKLAKPSNFGLNFSGSSENGAGFSPSFSISKKVKRSEIDNAMLTNSFSSGFNSRAGLTNLSYSRNLSGKFEGQSRSYGTLNSGYNPGLRHYSPSSNPKYVSRNFSGSVTTSLTLFGADGQFKVGFTANRSWIDEQFQTQINPAYGYFHLANGQNNDEALLDFNRDNDGSFTENTPYLASAFLTSDLFNVQAQGAGGSFRGYRNEVGYVFDPVSRTTSVSGDFGYEFGLGNNVDASWDIAGSAVFGYAGAWRGNSNQASPTVKFEDASGINETFAFQEANEKSVDTDPLFGTTFTEDNAERFSIEGIAAFTAVKKVVHGATMGTNNRTERIKRNQVMSFLTVGEVALGLGVDAQSPSLYQYAKSHHIGEITQLGTDGRRYVFGLPAYNISQEDVTFAVGNNLNNSGGVFPVNDGYSGLVDLGSGFSTMASGGNEKGIDNYYSQQTTPSYAHSFLLTAVLSDDYVDSDGSKGPTVNDLGSYVKVDYHKVENVKWRTPMDLNKAYYNEGLKSDKTDDKASFVFGKKELYYVKTIETKNYVAVFYCEDRVDGMSASTRNGGLDPTAGKMMLLKKITLYTKKEFTDHESNLSLAKSIQEVNFVYDYSLCQGYPANATGGGKLTLKEIYFTYQGSFKMKRSSYKFEYAGANADYNMKAVDRWGNYQATGSGAYSYTGTGPMPQGDYPYTTQDPVEARDNINQWSLSGIYLPSGGKIEVDYESDDYAFVQNMPASQMFPIIATGEADGSIGTSSSSPTEQIISSDEARNRLIYFNARAGHTNADEYGKPGQLVYYKCLVNVNDRNSTPKWEYVTGYGFIQTIEINSTTGIGKIKLAPVKLKDDDDPKQYSPIVKSAIQFARMNLSRTISDVNVGNSDDASENGILDKVTEVVETIATSFASFSELATGPNMAIYNKDKCTEILTQRSFIRLLEPTKRKLGGGSRVRAIKMYDNWKKMTSNGTSTSDNFSYGQEFKYELEDGTSSGVATYEPAMGGDENSMVRPKFYDDEIVFAPDYNMYIETPIMESQFPNPSVGYSRVVITDLKPLGITNSTTGKVVKEFYTAKDFPVISNATGIDHKSSNSFLPFSPQYEYMTATQGFYLELNDMHGKPKGEAVYAENKNEPISSVKYDYQMSPVTVNGIPGFKLENDVTTIKPDGSTSTAEVGVKYEAVADFRETSTQSIGVGPIEMNLNGLFAGPLYLVIPSVWAKLDLAEDRFRTAVLNKVVNKFGVLSRVTADTDGSIVETKNLAYDSETGEVLVTETTNNFNDAVFSLNFPAYWKYDQVGLAYQNIGYTVIGYPIGSDGFMALPSTAIHFFEGDEVIVTKANGSKVNGWVLDVKPAGIRIIDIHGAAIVTSNASVKVIRSGHRNKQTLSMANITSNSNPLSGLSTEIYHNVLNAGAVQFSEDWGTFCNCFGGRENQFNTKNPFVKGTRGNWRPVRSFTYLTNRTQATSGGNSNIRRDGVFASFSPYHFYYQGEWRTNPSNWTFVSEVTQFSPNGSTLETKDALGRYSASLFSYKNTLTTAVAANAKLSQIADGSFEDLAYQNCMDQGIFGTNNTTKISNLDAHTGRYSVKVPTNTSVNYGLSAETCTVLESCNLTLTASSANTYTINGTVTSSVVYPAVSGTGSASVSGGVVTITYDNLNYFEIVVDLYNDSTKCTTKVKFYNTPSSLGQLNMEVVSVNVN